MSYNNDNGDDSTVISPLVARGGASSRNSVQDSSQPASRRRSVNVAVAGDDAMQLGVFVGLGLVVICAACPAAMPAIDEYCHHAAKYDGRKRDAGKRHQRQTNIYNYSGLAVTVMNE